MIVRSEFVPAKGLTSGHLQTIMPILFKGPPNNIRPEREQYSLSDSEYFHVDWINRQVGGPIVILLHGVAGSIQSYYIKSVIQAIRQSGWRALLLHYRDSIYHLGDTPLLNALVKQLRTSYAHTPIYAIGFSMGGNLLLKWLGEKAGKAEIDGAVAVSTPYDLCKVSSHLRHGAARLYQRWLINELRDLVKARSECENLSFDMDALLKSASFWQIDETINAPMHGFTDITEYYRYHSSREYLANITVPTLCINALDDPFIPKDVIPTADELSELITLELSDFGGHVGFLQGEWWQPSSWIQERAIQYLQQLNGEILC